MAAANAKRLLRFFASGADRGGSALEVPAGFESVAQYVCVSVEEVMGAIDEIGGRRDGLAYDIDASCGFELQVRGTGEERWCVSLQCSAQVTRRLMHWASRQAADMEGVGDVWIERLAEHGVPKRRSDFYDLTAERLLGYERMGEVSAKNMVDSIASSIGMGLRRALIGLAIPMASEGTAKRLCPAGYQRIEDVAAATVEDLVAIRDIGPKVGRSPMSTYRLVNASWNPAGRFGAPDTEPGPRGAEPPVISSYP